MAFASIERVAELLDIKPDTAYRWAASGYLPCLRLGRGKCRRTVRFDLEEIRRWAEDQRHPQRAHPVGNRPTR